MDKFNEFSIIPKSDFKNIFISIESKLWKRPGHLSLENLGGVLDIKINDEFKERNVTSVEYVNQEQNPNLPPNTFNVNTRTHIAVDENYLYVWIPSLKRWKRIILSDWNSNV